MNLTSLIAVYFVTWWVCLFIVLPFGVRSQHEAGDVTDGTDPGAPQRAALFIKLAVNTVLAAIVVALLYWLLSSEWLQRYWT